MPDKVAIRLRPEDVFAKQSLDELSSEAKETLLDYLTHFAMFDETDGNICRCGRTLGVPGTVMNMMAIHTATWSLQNGEAHCYVCDWPVRVHHVVKIPGGGDPFWEVWYPLIYHPDYVEEAPRAG